MASIFKIIFLSGVALVPAAHCQQNLMGGPNGSPNVVEENENLEALIAPENYIADWLPALNLLGLALAVLKLKGACIDLQGVQARLESSACVGGESLSQNLTEIKRVLDKLMEEATVLENTAGAGGSVSRQGISTILVQTADVHNLRVNANVAVKSVVDILSRAQAEQECLKNRDDLEPIRKDMDAALQAYWSKVIPITSSVFKVTYGETARMRFKQLVDETFMT